MSFEFLNFETLNHFKITTFLYVQINDFEIKMTIKERKFWVKSDFFTPKVITFKITLQGCFRFSTSVGTSEYASLTVSTQYWS
jgi:hypothetical protein